MYTATLYRYISRFGELIGYCRYPTTNTEKACKACVEHDLLRIDRCCILAFFPDGTIHTKKNLPAETFRPNRVFATRAKRRNKISVGAENTKITPS